MLADAESSVEKQHSCTDVTFGECDQATSDGSKVEFLGNRIATPQTQRAPGDDGSCARIGIEELFGRVDEAFELDCVHLDSGRRQDVPRWVRPEVEGRSQGTSEL